MVMAKAGRTGNWRRHKVNGQDSASDGVMFKRGMKTLWPVDGPVTTSASIKSACNFFTISLVPFARPDVMIRSKIIGQPSCKCIACGGTPDISSLFKKSKGKEACSPSGLPSQR